MVGPAKPERFRELFAQPSIAGMLALSSLDFREFVAYVFKRAGYEVSEPVLTFARGVDLLLPPVGDARSAPAAVVVERNGLDKPLTDQSIRKLRQARVVRKGGALGYCVITGNFDKAAYEQARAGKRVFLLNGEQLCRYIQYVRGSRFDETTGITVRIPPDIFATPNAITNKADHHAKILVIANNKGGVGKTTTVRHLALGLAHSGRRVLVVDLDPQGNLTEAFLSDNATPSLGAATEPNLAQYFAGQRYLRELVRPTSTPGISLLPAHQDLSLLDTGGAGRPDVETHFASDLLASFAVPTPQGERSFDWIILDTPPAISLFTRAALAAADYVLAPARSRPSSLSGIRNMLHTLDTMGELTGNRPQLLGCLITHWYDDQQSTDTYTRLEELFDNRQSRILANEIPFDVTVEKTHGQTHHRASDAYDRVVQEVLSHVERS